MKAYIQAFVNSESNNWARLLSIVKFVYNNAMNVSTSYMPFKLNYNYHFYVSYKEDVDPHSTLESAEELLTEPRMLITMCWEIVHHDQKL